MAVNYQVVVDFDLFSNFAISFGVFKRNQILHPDVFSQIKGCNRKWIESKSKL
jgi:hypothetical protein